LRGSDISPAPTSGGRMSTVRAGDIGNADALTESREDAAKGVAAPFAFKSRLRRLPPIATPGTLQLFHWLGKRLQKSRPRRDQSSTGKGGVGRIYTFGAAHTGRAPVAIRSAIRPHVIGIILAFSGSRHRWRGLRPSVSRRTALEAAVLTVGKVYTSAALGR
jgi:hypothetical protein